MKKQFLLLAFLFIVVTAFSQQSLNQPINLIVENQPLSEAFYQLIEQEGVNISFRNELLPQENINVVFTKLPLRKALDQLLSNTQLSYKLIGNQIIIVPRARESQQSYTISGFVTDAKTGEHLIGANIQDLHSNKGTVSNEYGFFSLTLHQDQAYLNISYLGYQNWYQALSLSKNQSLNIELTASITLQEVIIYAKDDSIRNPIGGMATGTELKLGKSQLLPSLAGEPDIIRTALLLPGVSSGSDGAEGLQIRGGDAGQNLVLLDGVPVYYVNHAIGLFSIFNTNAVRSAQLFRGGFPARYSGRLSSVLDVRMKEGNQHEFKSSAALGLLSARFSTEGPIVKERSSFFISGRWSFIHAFLKERTQAFKQDKGQDGNSDYRFYDLNAKFNYSFSNKNRLFLSLYRGHDNYDDLTTEAFNRTISDGQGNLRYIDIMRSNKEGIKWYNTLGALRWNSIFNDRLFANFSLQYSELNQSSFFDELDISSETPIIKQDTFSNQGLFQSGIQDIGLKADWHYFPTPQHQYRFGLTANRRIFEPGALLSEESVSESHSFENNTINTTEISAYNELQGNWRNKWRYNAGIHFSAWYVEDKRHFSAQPRLSLAYQLNDQSSIKLSSSRMVQYLHLLKNTTTGLPIEIWVPSTKEVKPAKAWVNSLGYRLQFGKQYKLEVETYHKNMQDLLAFEEDVESFEDWEEHITQGKGEAYGIECMLSKTQGNLTGWINYTLSKSTRQYTDINLGRVYPFKYDRPHNLKLALIYKLNPKLYFSANWFYSSGFAFTLPLVKFSVGVPGQILPGDFNPEIFTTDAKNNYRMPAYHRLDVNLHYEWSNKNETLNHQLNIGVYNAYNRNNPLYYDVRLFFVNEDFTLTSRFSFVEVQLTPILPSISYQIKF